MLRDTCGLSGEASAFTQVSPTWSSGLPKPMR